MKLYLSLLFVLLLVTGCGQNTEVNTKNISNQTFDKGSNFISSLEKIKTDIESANNVEITSLDSLSEIKATTKDENEKQFIELTEQLFVLQTVYLADFQDDGKVKNETKENFDKVLNKLNKDFGVQIGE
ncbi:hypothetical protein [Bacillus sp. AG4(2022)]|uniref:hypothetical protein n=1 Tax=Bacillus sp. AG4(2022) TaxID=2962594 RepID=UPI002881245B|nr:hypothetical protein [Bacillus sp. AG4(2022)]MDT0160263.1 hypothetical protein [Bacillus sp. AG4(2022)]